MSNPELEAPDWTIWGMRAPEGSGKTQAALEWVARRSLVVPQQSSLIMVPRAEDVAPMAQRILDTFSGTTYEPGRRKIVWTKPDAPGFFSRTFIAASTEYLQFRGVQAHFAYANEYDKWVNEPDISGLAPGCVPLDTLMFSTRLGSTPQIALTQGVSAPKYSGPARAIYTLDRD
jgi:phage terminase large subunit-like protein